MHRTLKLLLGLLFVTAGSMAATSAWNAARWEALFDGLPAPPAQLAQTTGTLVMRPGDADRSGTPMPAGATLEKSRAAFHAGFAAVQADAMQNLPGSTRGLSDPGDAGALAARMQNASQAEKMAMAMQYAAQMRAGAQTAMANPQGMLATANLGAYVVTAQQQVIQILRDAQQVIGKLKAENDQRHDAADALLRKAYLDCPRPATCGDTTECSPNAACVAAVNTRLPQLVGQHRQIAQAELTAERTAYLRAYAALQPVFAHITDLLAKAEQAGAQTASLQLARNLYLSTAGHLQLLDAEIVMRAGFWQGAQARPVAPTYLAHVPAFYQFGSGPDALTEPPASPPKDW